MLISVGPLWWRWWSSASSPATQCSHVDAEVYFVVFFSFFFYSPRLNNNSGFRIFTTNRFHTHTHQHSLPCSPFSLTPISLARGWCWCVEALVAQHNTVLLCQLWPWQPHRSWRTGLQGSGCDSGGIGGGLEVSCPACQACWSGSVVSPFREYTGCVLFWTLTHNLT